MITSTQIYWLLMLDNVNVLMCGMAILFIIFSIIGLVIRMAIVYYYSKENPWRSEECRIEWESNKRFFINMDSKNIIIIIPLTIIVVTIACLIPSTKQMAVILVAPKVINNEQVQKLPNQVLELANEWLEELKPKGVK